MVTIAVNLVQYRIVWWPYAQTVESADLNPTDGNSPAVEQVKICHLVPNKFGSMHLTQIANGSANFLPMPNSGGFGEK